MADPRLVKFVQMIPLFQNLTEEQAGEVADILQYREVQPGTVVYRQGEMFNAMVIFVEGGGRLLLVGEDGIERSVGDVEPGEIIGESSLFIEDERDVTLLITRPSKIFVITKSALDRLRNANPALDQNLNIRQDIRKRLGLRLFKWLRPGESTVLYKRRHEWAYYKKLWLPAILLIILGILAWAVWRSSEEIPSALIMLCLRVISLGAAIFIPIALSIFYYLDWRNDYLVITNQRVVREENPLGLLGEMTVSQVSIKNIQNVNFEQRSPFAHYFGFGDLIIATAGAEGSITFGPVSDPQEVQDAIFKLRDRYKAKQMAEYRNTIRAEIARRLGLESLELKLDLLSGDGGEPAVKPEPPSIEPSQIGEKPSPFSFRFIKEVIIHWIKTALEHFKPSIRMEEGEVVTYRKHWIVLISAIATPTTLACLIVTIPPLMRYHEFWPLDSRVPWEWVIVGALTLFIIDMGWWIWQFDDWRNDLYQVTSTSVIAEKKGPFGTEGYRKVAGLDQIQSVDVRVKGLKQRLFNYGQVIIHTAGQEGALVFDTVFKPTLVAEDVDRRRRAFTMRKEEKEEQEQHELLAEWFAIYHQATHPEAFSTVTSPYRRVYKAPPEIQAVLAADQDTRIARRDEMGDETSTTPATADQQPSPEIEAQDAPPSHQEPTATTDGNNPSDSESQSGEQAEIEGPESGLEGPLAEEWAPQA